MSQLDFNNMFAPKHDKTLPELWGCPDGSLYLNINSSWYVLRDGNWTACRCPNRSKDQIVSQDKRYNFFAIKYPFPQ